MNFMQWLNSLDELLFEILSWVIFFPITLWRIIRHPLSMMAYAEAQLALPEDDQYGDALSPPIFLVLSLLLAQALELTLVGTNAIVRSRHGLASLVDDNTSLLLLRLILFGIFPLLMATRLVRKRGVGLDRKALKPPFYAQCYLAAPFALTLGIGGTMMTQPWDRVRIAGLAVMVVALLAYGIVQTRWFAVQLDVPPGRAFIHASFGMVESIVIAMGVAWLFTL
ncbi:MAG: hypothetical protein WC729_15215 [Sphingomonas sp.]|jgi:hypothetical protein|uniref:hypothetical protein n=1 Tax=Sphingomonas sp. TaxID=28214 RepID=UPI0035659E1C